MLRDIKDHLNECRDVLFSWIKRCSVFPRIDENVQTNPNQNSSRLFLEKKFQLWEDRSRIRMEVQTS